jgi:hypothetical protein
LADQNEDGAVSLGEVFDYSSRRTIASSARSLAGLQHPTYRYGLAGRRDIVVTRFREDQAAQSVVTFFRPGIYLFRRGGAAGDVEAEVAVESRAKAASFSPGSYFVQHLAENAIFEGMVTISERKTMRLDPYKLKRVPYESMVRKGARPFAISLGFRADTGTPLLDAFDRRIGLGGRLAWVTAALTFDLTLMRHEEVFVGLPGDSNIALYNLRLGFRKAIDLGRWWMGFGGRAGVLLAFQDFPRRSIDNVGPAVSPVGEIYASATLPIRSRLMVDVELGAQAIPARFETALEQKRTVNDISPFFRLELGWIF